MTKTYRACIQDGAVVQEYARRDEGEGGGPEVGPVFAVAQLRADLAAGVCARNLRRNADEVVPVDLAGLVPHGAGPVGEERERGRGEEEHHRYESASAYYNVHYA